nr:hypothetical protein [Tatlockia sp.]
MPINQDLSNLLTDENSLRNLNPEEATKAIEALDALLVAGYADEAARKNFRQALITKRDFWNPLLNKNDQIAHEAPVNDENNSTLEYDTKANLGDVKNFQTLARQATVKRVVITLKDAKDAQLEEIIKSQTGSDDLDKAFRQHFFDSQGKSKFGKQFNVKGWNQDTGIARAQFDTLKEEAKRELLIRKINTLNKTTDMSTLQNLLTGDFTQTVKALFGAGNNPHPVADSMKDNLRLGDVTRAIAKRGLLLEIAEMKPDAILALGESLNSKATQFRTACTNIGSNFAAKLANGDIDAIKANLGSRYLRAYVPTLGENNLAFLNSIAKSINAVALKEVMKNNLGEDAAFLDLALKDNESIADLRELAARNALKQEIAKCDDPAALDALIKAKTKGDIQRILKTHASLGYKNEEGFQAAFNKPDVKDIVTLAHVRKNITTIPQNAEDPSQNEELLKNHCEKLKAVALSDSFLITYREKFFPLDVDTQLQNELGTYFNNPENIKKARQDALLTYVKAKFSDAKLLDNATLGNMLPPNTTEKLIAGVNSLLEDKKNLNDLIPKDSWLELEIRRYAAAEDMIRLSKNTKTHHTRILGLINTLATNPNPTVQLVANAPTKERNQVLAQMAESFIRAYPKTDDSIPKLVALAKETNLEAFKNKLTTEFGIVNRDWVNEKTMKQVQEGVLPTLTERSTETLLKFGSKAHPELVKLISKLPFEKQRALLDKPYALTALAAAENKEEIERIVGDS